MMKPLLDDLYAPITSEIGFLECDAKTAADAFQKWQVPIQSLRGVHLTQREVAGDLSHRLQNLLPLTSHEARRFLFSPTMGPWTAYFDNGWRGPDVFSTVSYLCTQIGCRGIRGVAVAHTLRRVSGREVGRSGATGFALYVSDSTNGTCLNIRRSVFAVFDSKWTFDAVGEPLLEFEETEQYKARRIRERFTPEMLDKYLRCFGIRFFAPEFYEVPQPAYLITKDGPCAAGLNEYSLEEIRSTW